VLQPLLLLPPLCLQFLVLVWCAGLLLALHRCCCCQMMAAAMTSTKILLSTLLKHCCQLAQLLRECWLLLTDLDLLLLLSQAGMPSWLLPVPA
jgi:hypothetical protein